MSTTRGAVRMNSRTLTMDVQPSGGSHAVGDDIFNLLINARVQDVLNEIPVGSFKSPNLVTLVSGLAFYPLGAVGVAYTAIGDVIYRARGRVLKKTTIDKLEGMRQGIQPAVGFPQWYAMFEQQTDNTVQIAFWPTPGDNTIATGPEIDVYVTTNRVNLTADSDAIFFQNALVRALEKAVAAEVITMMPQDQQRINPNAAQMWMTDFQRMAQTESRRVSRIRAQRSVTLVVR